MLWCKPLLFYGQLSIISSIVWKRLYLFNSRIDFSRILFSKRLCIYLKVNFTLEELLTGRFFEISFVIRWCRKFNTTKMDFMDVLFFLLGLIYYIWRTSPLIILVKVWNITILIHISITWKLMVISLCQSTSSSISIVHYVWPRKVLLINRLLPSTRKAVTK